MQNSILFDFYSLVDKELSVIKFLAGEYRDSALESFDKHKVLYTSDIDWKIARVQNKDDVFQSVMIGDEFKKVHNTVLNSLWTEFQNCILEKYAFDTDINRLISGYRRIGNGGIIKIAVFCENETQKSFVLDKFPDVIIELGDRVDVDLKKYNRIVVGNYADALKYNYPSPKSICVLNFNENYDKTNFTLLNPELVIKLGDVHDIEIMSAYSISTENE